MNRDDLIRQRQVLGVSQSKLAKLLGVERSSVSRWESGEIQINPLLERALRDLVREQSEALAGP